MKKISLIVCALFLTGANVGANAAAQEAVKSNQHQTSRIDKAQRSLRSQPSDKKSFRINYTPIPDPIPLNQHFRLRFQVQDAQNKLLEKAQIKVDAGMPEHNHGMNVKPVVKELGKGVFEVRGLLFHMPGYWEIYVDIEHQGKKEQAIFGVTVDMKPTPLNTQDHEHHH